MIPMPENSHAVGIVGSDSSTNSLTVDVIHAAKSRSLNGKMVLIAPHDDDDHPEYALGTVTGITTRNRFHEDPAIRGVIALRGGIDNITARADLKTANVDIQAAFRDHGTTIRPLGGSLSFAPDTGERVHVVTADTVNAIASAVTNDLFYCGTMYRQNDIPLPLSIPDFGGARGSSMMSLFGPSGSGKTYVSAMFVGAQMRHRNMSFLLIDPQMQFSTNAKVSKELPFDLRALAEAQGRDVRQLSIVGDIQMSKNPGMFISLLDNANFLAATSGFGASVKAHEVRDLLHDYLTEENKDWTDDAADDLLAALCQHLIDHSTSVMSTDTAREKFENRLLTALSERSNNGAKWRTMMKTFGAFHAMYAPNRPDGTPKVSIDDMVRDLCTAPAGATRARPFYILALGAPAGSQSERGEAAKAMRSTGNQMIVLRALFSALEKEARRLYQTEGADPANLLVVMDEAARFTSDSSRAAPEARQMADDMARYMREIRKYAVGFALILQEPSVMHESIWKQLRNGFRAFAGGMVGNDLDKVREQIGSGGALNLYQQLAQPSVHNPVYPWMLCGSVSPLNATNNPLFMESFNSQKWVHANRHWLPGTFNHSDIWAGGWG